ncbi:DNA alkylation repair protein [Alkalihalobacillus sp. FSL R5-0424]
MELRKAIYNEAFIQQLKIDLAKAEPRFKADEYQSIILQSDWEQLELMQRKRRITEAIHATLPASYQEALDILMQVAPNYSGLAGLVFSDYVQVYGLNDWEVSIKALERFTQYSTAEFAVRPFFIKDSERMIQQSMTWAQSENEHVRRLASEGSRPRLPWGISIPTIKENPALILPILESLKQDPSLYVRRSVANSLNDVTKTHPALFKEIATNWVNEHSDTDWIIKHASRSLLKKGDPDILHLFGYENSEKLHIQEFQCGAESLQIGEVIDFSFQLQAETETKLRIDYAIDYVKARGNRTRKVFKLSDTTIKKNETKNYSRTHSFQDLSTRTHYPGTHQLTIIVNGEDKLSVEFDVI